MPELPRKESSQSPRRPDGALHGLVQAEKLFAIALLIPASTVIGWLIGLSLDHALHKTWIYIAGLIFGAAAGFVQMFRTVLQNTKE